MVKRGGNCFNSTSAHWSYTENAISKSVLWIGLSYFSKNAWKRIAHAEFIWNFPVCTYFSVSIFRSLVDLGTALSKRSSVVIFDMFIFTPQLQSLHSCRISPCSLPDKKKKTGMRPSPLQLTPKGRKKRYEVSCCFWSSLFSQLTGKYQEEL